MNIVYFLQRSDGYVKIGTTKNYKARLSGLIRQYGDLTLLGLMTGSYDIEEQLHLQFSKHRASRTEFFAPDTELLAFIGEYARLNLDDVLEKPVVNQEASVNHIKVHLAALLDKKFSGRRINISAIAAATTLTRQTVMQWYYEPDSLKRVELDVMERWCAYLNCQPGDILTYEDDTP